MSNTLTTEITKLATALATNPTAIKLHHKIAMLYLQTANLPKAQSHLEQIIMLAPQNIESMNDLAVVLAMQGKQKQAISLLKNCITIMPNDPNAHVNLGKIYTELNELPKAKACFLKAITLTPKHIIALNNLATIYLKTNEQLQALKCLETALAIDANNLMILFNYSKLLKYFNDLATAKAILTKILTVTPNNATVIAELADLFIKTGQNKTALTYITKALSLEPDNYYANYYYAIMLYNKRDHKKCLYYCKNALIQNNNSLELFGILACIQLDMGSYQEFEDTKQQAKQLINSGQYHESINPFLAQILINDDNDMLHLLTKQWAANVSHQGKNFIYPRKKYGHKKLRIGYISGDFGDHPIGLLIENLFALHDRNDFIIYGFATKVHNCPRYQKICDQFDELILLDLKQPIKAAKTIHALEIDILIDLVGPTDNNNYAVLALQPATIQAHMLGYTGTMGANYIQYFITTQTIVSQNMTSSFSETLVYLPDTDIAHHGFVMPKQSTNISLPKDKFVFLAHHASYRINQEVLQAWSQILQEVPNSILWFYCNNTLAQQNIIQYFQNYNLAANRIIFYSNNILTDNWQHQAAHLFLDAFSHSSGTLTFLCAWAGLPMLTVLGNTPQTRVCANFCKAIDVPEQIVSSKTKYIQRAIYLATHPAELQKIKNKLLANRHSTKLFNQPIYIKHLETAYQLMYEDFCNNNTTKQIIVPS